MARGYKGLGQSVSGTDETNPFVERMSIGSRRAGFVRSIRPLTQEQSSRLQAEWRRHWIRPQPSMTGADTIAGFDKAYLLIFVLGCIAGAAGAIAIMALLGYL